MVQIDPKLSPIISDLLEGGVTPKVLMEAAVALSELAFKECSDHQLENLDLDEVQDGMIDFLAFLDECSEACEGEDS